MVLEYAEIADEVLGAPEFCCKSSRRPVVVAMMFVASFAALTTASLPTISCDPSDAGKCMCDGAPIGPTTWVPPAWLVSKHRSIYDTYAYQDSVRVPLSNFKAKAAMVINVASA